MSREITKLLKENVDKEIKAPKGYTFSSGTWTRTNTVRLIPISKILPDGSGFTLGDRRFKTSGLSTIRRVDENEVHLQRNIADSYENTGLSIDWYKLSKETFYPRESGTTRPPKKLKRIN